MKALGWRLAVTPEFKEDYRKLCGRNAGFRRAVDKKLQQVLLNPYHFKPLRGRMHGVRRVHFEGSYVILFEPDEATGRVIAYRLLHHDEAYGI